MTASSGICLTIVYLLSRLPELYIFSNFSHVVFEFHNRYNIGGKLCGSIPLLLFNAGNTGNLSL